MRFKNKKVFRRHMTYSSCLRIVCWLFPQLCVI